jgi:hypothetical protein
MTHHINENVYLITTEEILIFTSLVSVWVAYGGFRMTDTLFSASNEFSQSRYSVKRK